jgi:predicted dinucleotide-binding enzyme
MEHFDAIIIGTGQAGPPLAARFAGAGKTVATGAICVENIVINPRDDSNRPANLHVLFVPFPAMSRVRKFHVR